jgi:hypothetical protein
MEDFLESPVRLLSQKGGCIVENKAVYEAISNVQAEMASIGISKDKKNAQQGYNFRGIDDVYDALAPILAKHKLCILPRVTSREVVERQSAKGNALFYVTVGCEFDMVSAVDSSMHTVKTYGEAMDSADKATNKAMSAAYKYACFQAFCIPVDTVDADADSHEVKAKKKAETPTPPKPPAAQGQSPAKKKLEAMIKEAGIDRERLKEWLYCLDWISLKDDKPSLSTLSEAHLTSLLDKWTGACETFKKWDEQKRKEEAS